MKLAIVGSRTFNNYDLVETIIQTYFIIDRDFELVSGGAKGADKLAELFAENHSLYINIIRPNWQKYGGVAGFKRNQQIIDACDVILAFWDGKSNGTRDSINKAKKAKKLTITVYV